MSTSLPPIEEDLVSELRQRTVEAVQETGVENFHPADVERIKTDDYWLWRFIMHQRKDISWAFDMLMECIKWRKEFGVNDIKESEFPQFLDDIGAMYVCNKDREGHRLVIMHVRRYRKEPIIAKLIRRYFVHYMEKLEKEDPYHRISIVFDMQNAGLSNVDMDFLFFMFSCFKTYYPSGVAYIFAFDMPWLFSAMWKVVKGWLSPAAANKIKFVNKKTIGEFVDPEELLVEFGGNIPQVEKQVEAEKLGQQLMKMASDEVAKFIMSSAKVVETQRIINQNVLLELKESPSKMINHGDFELNISPSVVEFKDKSAVINLSSTCKNSALAYKIRTTAPEKFRVRPSQGFIREDSTIRVAFTLLPGFEVCEKDKFLIVVMNVEGQHVALLDSEMNEQWRACPSESKGEYQVNCREVKEPEAPNSHINKPTTLNDLFEDCSYLSREFVSLRKVSRFIIVIQFLIIFFLIAYNFLIINQHYTY